MEDFIGAIDINTWEIVKDGYDPPKTLELLQLNLNPFKPKRKRKNNSEILRLNR